MHGISDLLITKELVPPLNLRSYLGLANYYHCVLPDLASVLGPVYELLETDVD